MEWAPGVKVGEGLQHVLKVYAVIYLHMYRFTFVVQVYIHVCTRVYHIHVCAYPKTDTR